MTQLLRPCVCLLATVCRPARSSTTLRTALGGRASHHLQGRHWCPQTQQEHRHHHTEQSDTLDTAMGMLQDVFGMTHEDAQYILISCSVPEQDILSNLRILHQCGIGGEQVHRIPWIIGQSADVLEEKLRKIQEPFLFRQHSDGLGFCQLRLGQINTYQAHFRKEAPNFPHHPNRIYYLAERIKVPVELFSEKVGKPHRTLLLNIKRIDSFIDMFHQYGMSPEDIVSDLWVFEYSLKNAEERLRRATYLGYTALRPWMCRCSNKIFDRFCERYQSEKELLGNHKSLLSYLAERLHCEPSLLEEKFESNEILKRLHISKFSRILDLLYAEGITAQEIMSCMRVFQYSEERTAARIKELKDIGFFPFPMILLCRTPAQFKNIVAMYRKKFKEEG
ncbi:transcription termination factor, mitochondrial-like isoform X1 [Portunus trituberculatus]|uniref:transcription termination factor, mitochondrial-like isoform X1 n=1 Tax=Portunus trituberculatus TaxID=210409 RepID=UPI001E1D14A2|nr:transcription termination factor, mitochondrial-like isoform X1 [Portunus trituberculatus]XP_045121397.1 transcription termination factor, mitochondrial-like isoform X1 [Portunus trituberculatus]XP_045121407.1 transcription termination factor, mitochondrial-like isoform X1 [Portunus trituberculatus]XP_045121417.1 transcription termination factor, mitochondrial-like isoform X1 [Portunus trituberculatus]XP_045121427.1 transcription termination factor, mitochondrial-like isoform X1 [Portunus tr